MTKVDDNSLLNNVGIELLSPKSYIKIQSSAAKVGKTRSYLPSISKSSTKDSLLTMRTLEKMSQFNRQESAIFEKKCEIVNKLDTRFFDDDDFGGDYHNLTSDNDPKERQYKSEICN